jgi:hypothetical protein
LNFLILECGRFVYVMSGTRLFLCYLFYFSSCNAAIDA